MTTAYERTRSVIETGGFLSRISRDKTLPDNVREQARQLLRHYPTAEAVRLAGRCEAIRQDEVSKLSGSPKALHPALATWPLLDSFFCDPTIHDASPPTAQPIIDRYIFEIPPKHKGVGMLLSKETEGYHAHIEHLQSIGSQINIGIQINQAELDQLAECYPDLFNKLLSIRGGIHKRNRNDD
ncbi:BPSL0761 family protein [Pseudomonas syringae]|nr:BPSL0761 family protein [Pseudomonas syringae]